MWASSTLRFWYSAATLLCAADCGPDGRKGCFDSPGGRLASARVGATATGCVVSLFGTAVVCAQTHTLEHEQHTTISNHLQIAIWRLAHCLRVVSSSEQCRFEIFFTQLFFDSVWTRRLQQRLL